jgi:cytoskeleton protein RodZ
MSELADKPAQPADGPSGHVPTVSAGTLLRQAREAAGLHIAALAVSLKVPVKKLEALEADRIDLLPDAVFARALAASVCRTLKTDPAPVLASLPQTNLAQLQLQVRAPATAISNSSPETRSGGRPQLSKPVMLFALALMVAALLIGFFPASDGLLSSLNFARPGTPKPPLIAAPQSSAADGNSQPPLIASTSLAGSGLPDSTAVKSSVASAEPTPASTAPLTGTAETGSTIAASTGGEIVVLKSLGSAWVEVLDGKRTVRLRKTMLPGESVGVSADLPLYVTVGRADTIEVQVRGKPFDLAPMTKDNVARFEVRQ